MIFISGHPHQTGFNPLSPTMPSRPTTLQRKPLRHGIDAILHKAPPSSSSPPANHSPFDKPTLPHIETLRRSSAISGMQRSAISALQRSAISNMQRSAISDVSTSSVNWPTSGLESGASLCVRGVGDRGDRRCVSRRCADSWEDQEVVVVVDDTNEALDWQEDSSEDSQDPGDLPDPHTSPTIPPNPHWQPVPDPSPVLQRVSQNSDLSPHRGSVPSPRSAFRSQAVDSSEDVPQGSLDKVKSAFRPIVRPWLLEKGVGGACSAEVRVKASREQVCRLGTVQGKELGLSSLDAISMLRKQSTAFSTACTRGHHLVHKTPAMPALIPAGLVKGQPLPGTLTSWLTWLRSGGMPFTPHPPPHHFSPGAPPPCRGVAPASGVPVSGHLPPQAPRYNCEACGKSYSTFGGLSKHKQFHCAAQVKKDFRCKFCDKSYSSLGALKMHIRTHTLPCKCTVCGKAFSRPWLLQGHLRTHTGEKPFSCPHCARAFADRSNLRAHLQTHSDVKKYSCRHCCKTFSRVSLLVKHRESSCVGLHG
ncbi:hypothetical protein ACOMHN_017967 [Nucella lapillus]